MNKLKASGIGLAAALGTVAGIAMLPGPGVTASISPGTGAGFTTVQHAADAPRIVLVCTDCETGSDQTPASAAPFNADKIPQGAPTALVESDAPITLVALVPHGTTTGGIAANTGDDADSGAKYAGSGGSGASWPFAARLGRDTSGTSGQEGAGNSASAGTTAPGNTTQAGSSASPDETQTAPPSKIAPVLGSCSTPPCQPERSTEPQTLIPPIASLPDTRPPEIIPDAPSQREPDALLPDLALEPVPDVPTGLLPDTSLVPAARTVAPRPERDQLTGSGWYG